MHNYLFYQGLREKNNYDNTNSRHTLKHILIPKFEQTEEIKERRFVPQITKSNFLFINVIFLKTLIKEYLLLSSYSKS